MGVAGGVGLGPRFVAAQRLQRAPRRRSSRSPRSPSSASFAPAASIGPRAPSRRADGRGRSTPLLKAAATPTNRPRASTGCWRGKRWACRPSLPADRFIGFDPPGRASAQRQARAGAGAHRRAGAGRGDASPPGEDRRAGRASRLDPDRQAARSSRARSCGSPTTASGAPAPMPPTAIPTRAGAPLNGWRVDPALAYGHIVQESAFRGPRSATPGAVGLMQVLPEHRAAGVAQPRRALHPRRAQRPDLQSRIWPELHRDDAAQFGRPRASCRESSPPTMPDRCRSRAGRRSTTAAIRCCGSS